MSKRSRTTLLHIRPERPMSAVVEKKAIDMINADISILNCLVVYTDEKGFVKNGRDGTYSVLLRNEKNKKRVLQRIKKANFVAVL